MKKIQIKHIIAIVAVLALVGLVIAAAVVSGGQEGALNQTAWALLPPVVAIGLALYDLFCFFITNVIHFTKMVRFQ